MLTTLTIDPGFRYLGLSRWDSDNGEFLDSQLITSPDKDDKTPFYVHKTDVLQFFADEFDFLITSARVNHVVVERMPFHGATTQRILTLMVLGALEVQAYLNNIVWHEVSAREVKQFVTGDSKATKAKMRQAIAKLYPQAVRDRKVTEIPFDEIDSIAVGHMYFNKELNGRDQTATAQDTQGSL